MFFVLCCYSTGISCVVGLIDDLELWITIAVGAAATPFWLATMLWNAELREPNTGGMPNAPRAQEKELDETVVLCAFVDGPRVGFALYKPQLCVVETFEKHLGMQAMRGCEAFESRDGENVVPGMIPPVPSGLQWFVAFLRHYNTAILLPDAGAEMLEKLVSFYGTRGGGRGSCQVLKLNAKSAFDADAAVQRLLRMYPQTTAEVWAARLHLHHRAMLSALSALLHFTTSVMSNVMNVVETVDPALLFVEEHTSKFLQLTRSEPHPCDYQGVGRAKEGLSLFSVLHHTQSAAGTAKLRQWFAMPSRQRSEIEQRQEVVSFFSQPAHQELLSELRHALHRIHPTDGIFLLLRGGKARTTHYRRLLETMDQYMVLYYTLLPVAHHMDLLQRLVASFTVEPIQEMAERVEHTIAGMKRGRGFTPSGLPMAKRMAAPPTYRGGPRPASYTHTHPTEDGEEEESKKDDEADLAAYLSGDQHAHELSSGSSAPHIQRGADPTGLLDELRARWEEMCLSLAQKRQEVWRRLPLMVRQSLGGPHHLTCRVLPPPHGYLIAIDGGAVAQLSEALLGGGGAHCPEREFSSCTVPPAATLQMLEEECGLRLHHVGGVSSSSDTNPARAIEPPPHVLYFKSHEMVELDEYVGDLQERIRMREGEMQWELDRLLVLHSLYLLPPSELLAELDCLLGFAFAAQLNGWTRPTLVEAPGVLRITNGWHPVLGCAFGRGALIPFSLEVCDPSQRLCVLLGVNNSGKSVLLTAVALMVFMAQLGSFVPAEQLSMSLFRSLLAASPTPMREASSFYAECVALSRTLAQCEADKTALAAAALRTSEATSVDEPDTCVATWQTSLILVDELGKGTSAEDGRSLLGSVLRYFAAIEPYYASPPSLTDVAQAQRERVATHWRPIVLCATHMVEMLDYSRDLQLHRRAAFPFAAVQLYDMQSVLVFQRRQPRRRRHRAVKESSSTSTTTTTTTTNQPRIAVTNAPPVETHQQDIRSEFLSKMESAGGEATHLKGPATDPLLLPNQLPVVDVMPTFSPYLITNCAPEEHEEAYFDYYDNYCGDHEHDTAHVGRRHRAAGALALGRRCGLDPWLQQCWAETINIIQQGTTAVARLSPASLIVIISIFTGSVSLSLFFFSFSLFLSSNSMNRKGTHKRILTCVCVLVKQESIITILWHNTKREIEVKEREDIHNNSSLPNETRIGALSLSTLHKPIHQRCIFSRHTEKLPCSKSIQNRTPASTREKDNHSSQQVSLLITGPFSPFLFFSFFRLALPRKMEVAIKPVATLDLPLTFTGWDGVQLAVLLSLPLAVTIPFAIYVLYVLDLLPQVATLTMKKVAVATADIQRAVLHPAHGHEKQLVDRATSSSKAGAGVVTEAATSPIPGSERQSRSKRVSVSAPAHADGDADEQRGASPNPPPPQLEPSTGRPSPSVTGGRPSTIAEQANRFPSSPFFSRPSEENSRAGTILRASGRSPTAASATTPGELVELSRATSGAVSLSAEGSRGSRGTESSPLPHPVTSPLVNNADEGEGEGEGEEDDENTFAMGEVLRTREGGVDDEGMDNSLPLPRYRHASSRASKRQQSAASASAGRPPRRARSQTGPAISPRGSRPAASGCRSADIETPHPRDHDGDEVPHAEAEDVPQAGELYEAAEDVLRSEGEEEEEEIVEEETEELLGEEEEQQEEQDVYDEEDYERIKADNNELRRMVLNLDANLDFERRRIDELQRSLSNTMMMLQATITSLRMLDTPSPLCTPRGLFNQDLVFMDHAHVHMCPIYIPFVHYAIQVEKEKDHSPHGSPSLLHPSSIAASIDLHLSLMLVRFHLFAQLSFLVWHYIYFCFPLPFLPLLWIMVNHHQKTTEVYSNTDTTQRIFFFFFLEHPYTYTYKNTQREREKERRKDREQQQRVRQMAFSTGDCVTTTLFLVSLSRMIILLYIAAMMIIIITVSLFFFLRELCSFMVPSHLPLYSKVITLLLNRNKTRRNE
eukprot:gene473-253_t